MATKKAKPEPVVHEVVIDNGLGVRTVYRVTAPGPVEARAVVQARLDNDRPPSPSIVDVASPADLAVRERQAQRDLASRQSAAR